MTQTARDKIRSGILNGKKQLKSEKLTIFEQEVEIRQPSIRDLRRLADDEKSDGRLLALTTLVNYAFVPGTDELVFGDEDLDELESLPYGDWVRELNNVYSKLTGINLGEAEKN